MNIWRLSVAPKPNNERADGERRGEQVEVLLLL